MSVPTDVLKVSTVPYSVALLLMKENVPLGYIQMIDGEKDPRVLTMVFRLTRNVIAHFPIGAY